MKSGSDEWAPCLRDALSKVAAHARQEGVQLSELSAGQASGAAELLARLDALVSGYDQARQGLDVRELAILEQEEALGTSRDELASEREALRTAEGAMDAERSQLEQRLAKFDADRRQVSREQAELRAQRAGLTEREEQVVGRGADAEAGFVQLRERALAKLAEARNQLLRRNEELRRQADQREEEHLTRLAEAEAELDARLAERRAALEKELQAQRDAARQEAEQRESGLREQAAGLAQKSRELAALQFDAGEAQKDADELQQHVKEYVAQGVEEQVAEVAARLEAREAELGRARSSIQKLECALQERGDAVRVLEHRSPEQVRAELERLRERVAELSAELANRPTAAESEELQDLRKQRLVWDVTRRTLQQENGRLEGRLVGLQVEVDSVELLRDRNEALLANQRLLRGALDELRTEVDERLDKNRNQPLFQELSRMDSDEELQRAPEILFHGPGEDLRLPEFADDLRHRIGHAPKGERPDLYYRAEDIRAFLGGLAMSHLQLLQGISGIGKSSLPRAFAEAVGGFCETVSVQAGWRDRNDLFGYYNAFERRYYELPFVQALYAARLPARRDRICIVLLDEMNLSHFEQYGADVLDVLERNQGADRRFELLSFQPPGEVPGEMVKGRYLPLPDNLWFVGTANHDETTKDFAPKTYDRSFVLELPGRPESFELRKTRQRHPVSVHALTQAFDRAARDQRKVGQQAIDWLSEHLQALMHDSFRVGWGGRLEGQIRRFVPVVVAAGGDLGEALDQLVATRLLRQIQGRHDNVEEDLQRLLKVLKDKWPPGAGARPAACERLLGHELRRLKA